VANQPNNENGKDGLPPVTPFLFVPQGVFDNGTLRPFPGIGWIDGPALMLVDETARRISCILEPDKTYRILALVGNSGLAPAQNSYAEFYINLFTNISYQNGRPEFLPEPEDMVGAVSLGVASVPSISSREVTWAMSPLAFNMLKVDDKHFMLGTSAHVLVRVFEPLNDVLHYPDFRARDDRKVGARFFTPDLSGRWSGDEYEYDRAGNKGKLLGNVSLDISQSWAMLATTAGAFIQPSDVRIAACPSLVSKLVDPRIPWKANSIGHYLTVNIGVKDQLDLILASDRTIKMHHIIETTPSVRDRVSSADLLWDGPSAFPQPSKVPDKMLLGKLSNTIPSYWPPKRKSDALLLRGAISVL
jgi:hypothetical protein